MSVIRRREGVDRDIAELAEFFLSRSEPVAFRFVDAVQTTLKDLAAMPGLGSPKYFNDVRVAGLRSWRVKGFPNHLIFYQPMDNGIMVLAVIHGARDLEPFLKQRA
jgi:toxin ParE1/3/4